MEVIFAILKQLPPFWPRLLVLIALLLLVVLPHTRQLLTRTATGARRLERARTLLEVRKLQLEVAALRASHPEVPDSSLDGRIAGILAEPLEPHEDARPTLPWRERLPLAAYGSAGFVLLGTLALGLSGRREGFELFTTALRELLFIVPCGLLASAIPTRNRWGPVFYAFLLPILVVALAVAARMRS